MGRLRVDDHNLVIKSYKIVLKLKGLRDALKVRLMRISFV